MLVFKAQNSINGVNIEGKNTPDIPILSNNKIDSEGVFFIKEDKSIYIPNYGKDTALLANKIGQSFIDLSSIPPITGSGSSTVLNPQFAIKLSELGQNIKSLVKELV